MLGQQWNIGYGNVDKQDRRAVCQPKHYDD